MPSAKRNKIFLIESNKHTAYWTNVQSNGRETCIIIVSVLTAYNSLVVVFRTEALHVRPVTRTPKFNNVNSFTLLSSALG